MSIKAVIHYFAAVEMTALTAGAFSALAPKAFPSRALERAICPTNIPKESTPKKNITAIAESIDFASRSIPSLYTRDMPKVFFYKVGCLELHLPCLAVHTGAISTHS